MYCVALEVLEAFLAVNLHTCLPGLPRFAVVAGSPTGFFGCFAALASDFWGTLSSGAPDGFCFF